MAEDSSTGPPSESAKTAGKPLRERHADQEQWWPSGEKIYRALISCLTSHIAALDRTGTIVMVNEAWMRFAHDNGLLSDAAIGVGANLS